MSRLAVPLLVALLMSAGSARAAGNPRPGTGVAVPGEWSGIWTSVDSVYDCTTQALIKVVPRTDTLCAGENVPSDPNAPPYNWTTCSGSADATHIQEHCTADGGLCGEACFVNDMLDLDATRTGDAAFWSWTTKTVSSCHFSFCDTCILTRSHATRVAPGPCGPVPTAPVTWGNLKVLYR